MIPDCPIGWYEFNSTCYKWFRTKSSWFEAFDVCKANNGNLAGIPDEAVNEFLVNYIPYGQVDDYCWVGGYELDAGSWAWDDGMPWAYTHWKEGEPNNDDGKNEDCLGMITWSFPNFDEEPGFWDDLHCDLEKSFVCSKQK